MSSGPSTFMPAGAAQQQWRMGQDSGEQAFAFGGERQAPAFNGGCVAGPGPGGAPTFVFGGGGRSADMEM